MKLIAGAALFLGAAFVAAQSVIDYSKVPSCAHQCSILQQAEANCVPPAAPVTNQGIYQSCVCQSTLLSTLKSSGSLCQQAGCDANDASKISQYYVALCNGPVVYPSSSTSTSPAATATTSSKAAAKTSATAAGAGSAGLNVNSQHQSWWTTHWKWAVMVIVLVVGGLLVLAAAIITKRHFHRKREAKRANMAATDGPHVQYPYTPSTPASKSVFSDGGTPRPMTMSGGLDGGIGGIAAPRGAPRMRSRSNTLQSMRLSTGGKLPQSEPVVWGPHQHLATAYRTDSPRASGPPSPTHPTRGVDMPSQVYRNSDALRSEPRFVNHRPLSVDNAISQEGRPHTSTGGAVRDSPARALMGVRSDPVLSPHVEGQTAEICDPSPRPSPNKLRRNY